MAKRYGRYWTRTSDIHYAEQATWRQAIAIPESGVLITPEQGEVCSLCFPMKSGKFWHLHANPGFEKMLAAKIKQKTLAEVKQAIRYAYLDEDLFDFLLDVSIRESRLAVLVGHWFPGRWAEIKKISQTDDFQDPPGYVREAYEQYMSRLEDA
jgi:hypothetical protein